jgi:general stress protein CsbA
VGGAVRFGFGRPQVYHTIGKRPTFPLVSRLYRNGYNALVLVVVLVLMSLLPSLTPFELICPVRQVFKALGFIRIQFLRCFLCLTASLLNKRLFSYI